MGAPTTFPFARMAAAFAAYESNARDAVRWAHRSWLAAALRLNVDQVDQVNQVDPVSAALERANRTQIDAASLALVRIAGMQPPSFTALRAPSPAVLDALPPEWGLRVLRMRALVLRRAEVRRLIDKRSRNQLSDWIGLPIDRLTEGAPGPTNTADIGRLSARVPLPALDSLDAQALACEGWALMMRDASVGAASFSLLRLALPRELRVLSWLEDSRRDGDADGTMRLLARLPALIPEWAWLFG